MTNELRLKKDRGVSEAQNSDLFLFLSIQVKKIIFWKVENKLKNLHQSKYIRFSNNVILFKVVSLKCR